jgi:hypothetical protein
VLQSKERAAWGSDGWLEDERCFAGRDARFAAHDGLLPAAAIFRRGGNRWGVRLLGWRTALAIRSFNHPSRPRIFPSIPGDALPGASKQDCYRTTGPGHFRLGAFGSLSSGHCQRACGHIWRWPPMKKRLGILALLVIIVLLALGRHFYGGEKVPAGQPPLVSLTPSNFDQLRMAFNAASGEVRIVLLLSPT